MLTERDEDMFSQAVSELLLNDERREKMAKKCVEEIHNFWTLEHAGERLLNHLNRAMERY